MYFVCPRAAFDDTGQEPPVETGAGVILSVRFMNYQIAEFEYLEFR
jgi:hypothetical protein